MHDIRCAMSVMDEECEVGRFAEICHSACFLDRSSGKFGLHELSVGFVVVCALADLCLCERCWRGTILCIIDVLVPNILQFVDGGGIISGGTFLDGISSITAAQLDSRLAWRAAAHTYLSPLPFLQWFSSVWGSGSCIR